MLISCPKCETTFSLPDGLFRPGRKARCSNCGYIFPMALPEAQPAAAPAIEEPLPDMKKSPKKRGIRAVLSLFAVLLCLAGVGAGGWMIYRSFSSPDKPVGNVGQTPAGQGDTAASEADPAAGVRDIDLVDVRQFIVKNDKLGDLVVIKGNAVNNFKVPKAFIAVEARLFAKNGTVIARQTRLCGPDPFLTQLQVLTAQGLEEALGNRVEVLLNNSNVEPKQSTPFWFVFTPAAKPQPAEGEKEEAGKPWQPWKDLWEFEVRPIDAKDVAPESAPQGNG